MTKTKKPWTSKRLSKRGWAVLVGSALLALHLGQPAMLAPLAQSLCSVIECSTTAEISTSQDQEQHEAPIYE